MDAKGKSKPAPKATDTNRTGGGSDKLRDLLSRAVRGDLATLPGLREFRGAKAAVWREVGDVAERGLHGEARTEEAGELLRLVRRLDDDEGLGHDGAAATGSCGAERSPKASRSGAGNGHDRALQSHEKHEEQRESSRALARCFPFVSCRS